MWISKQGAFLSLTCIVQPLTSNRPFSLLSLSSPPLPAPPLRPLRLFSYRVRRGTFPSPLPPYHRPAADFRSAFSSPDPQSSTASASKRLLSSPFLPSSSSWSLSSGSSWSLSLPSLLRLGKTPVPLPRCYLPQLRAQTPQVSLFTKKPFYITIQPAFGGERAKRAKREQRETCQGAAREG